MKLTNAQIKIMQEDLAAQLIDMLIKEQNMPMQEALDVFYNSDTYMNLANPQTGLFYQSPGYVFTFFKNELANGKMS